MTEPLYKKAGRKYVPVVGTWYEDRCTDQMKVGTFRLVYCYADGARRYEYEVTPATAPVMAAMQVAKLAMIEKIRDMSQMRPSGVMPYTKRQQALIEQFKLAMGGMYPSHWQQSSAGEIADAAIKAVLEYRP